MKYTLVDNTKRSVLIEGRDYGLGFGFCKRIKDELHVINPISPCKDYMNDVVFSEKTGKPYSAWGLNTEKQDIFEHGVGYVLMAVCGSGARSPSKYHGMEQDLKDLEANFKSMEKIINWFEKGFSIKHRTEIVKLEDNRFVAIAPMFWCEATYLISLYTLILRCAMPRGDVEPMSVLANDPPADDYSSAKAAIPKVKQMLKGTIPVQDFTKPFGVHDMGIVSFSFKS